MKSENDKIVLTEIRRKGQLYLIQFSNEFEIRATKRTIDHLELSVGSTFSVATFRELRKILESRFAYFTADSMLARRAYSIGEFKERLRRKDIPGNLIIDIVKNYKDKRFLDDFRYGVSRVQSLMERKPAGRGFLIADLQNRLIPRTIAEEVVDKALADVDEVDTAVRLLEKRQSAFAKFDIETARRKAYTYLSRRAISYRAAKEAFEKLYGNRDT
jgi:SOS response regulatory protein OraA/RecX